MKVEDELANALEKKGMSCKVRILRYFPSSMQHYDWIQIDIVINNKIAVEFKPSFTTEMVQTGIGQAILYLLFFEESWLAVPSIAIEVLKPVLEKIKLESFKVLDWENMILYEIKNGQIVTQKLNCKD